jgi:HK97 family phage prohead protease
MTPTTSRRTVVGGDREGRLFTTTLRLANVDTTAGYTMMEGRACPYGSWTTRWFFQESFAPGLFDKSIKEASRALPLLLFHDAATWPIGHATAWDSRDDGLWGVWALDDGAEAQRAAKLASEGHLPYLSVGYDPLLSEWEFTAADEWNPDDKSTLDRVTRTEGRLVETSAVSTPAFKEAEITLVRAGARPPRWPEKDPRPSLSEWRRWRSTIG